MSRISAWPLLAMALASGAAGVPMPARAAAPSGCTSIAAVPPTYSGIAFGAAIEGIFTNFNGMGSGCADCHTTSGGTITPAGDLDLDPADAPSPYANLVGVPSQEDPSMLYVVPNRPDLSLLFWKVNCDNPQVGARMPLDNYMGGLTAYQQALIYDWIAEGAPVGTTDGVFRNGFDMRGFAQ